MGNKISNKKRLYDYFDTLNLNNIEGMSNSQIYNAFPEIPKSSIRRSKLAYLKELKSGNHKMDRRSDRACPTVHTNETNTVNNNSNTEQLEDIEEVLTEDIIESAILRRLYSEEVSTADINTAINRLDKKKKISVDNKDTNNTVVQSDKLKELRDNLFV